MNKLLLACLCCLCLSVAFVSAMKRHADHSDADACRPLKRPRRLKPSAFLATLPGELIGYIFSMATPSLAEHQRCKLVSQGIKAVLNDATLSPAQKRYLARTPLMHLLSHILFEKAFEDRAIMERLYVASLLLAFGRASLLHLTDNPALNGPVDATLIATLAPHTFFSVFLTPISTSTISFFAENVRTLLRHLMSMQSPNSGAFWGRTMTLRLALERHEDLIDDALGLLDTLLIEVLGLPSLVHPSANFLYGALALFRLPMREALDSPVFGMLGKAIRDIRTLLLSQDGGALLLDTPLFVSRCRAQRSSYHGCFLAFPKSLVGMMTNTGLTNLHQTLGSYLRLAHNDYVRSILDNLFFWLRHHNRFLRLSFHDLVHLLAPFQTEANKP